MKIFDNGVLREMTEEEIALWEESTESVITTDEEDKEELCQLL
jgi:hypothetical protein